MTLVIVAGEAGSGKTELAKMIASALGWPMLDKDTLSRPLVEDLNTRLSGDPHDRHTETYLQKVRPLEYQILKDSIEENLALRVSVVAAAPYLKELSSPRWLPQIREQAHAAGHKVMLIWVSCDLSTMHSRIIARGALRDHWKLANWKKYSMSLNSAPLIAQADFVIDNSASGFLSLQADADRIISLLR